MMHTQTYFGHKVGDNSAGGLRWPHQLKAIHNLDIQGDDTTMIGIKHGKLASLGMKIMK